MATETILDRFDRLTTFLQSDPENRALLADCAAAAMEAGKLEEAAALYERLEAIEPLAGAEANAAGIAAMRSGDQERAQLFFARLLEEDEEDPGVRFNLAWSRALAKDFGSAQELLDESTIAALPQAAMLDLQIEHELGRFEQAGDKLDDYLQRFPDYSPLQAAASVLAMDIDRPDLARTAAEKAGDHPDALTTLASLDLGDNRLEDARAQYERALQLRPTENPRADIGLGLVDLAEGKAGAAAKRLDRGAEVFGDHLGTWIAAGWAHFIDGDLKMARARFETALAHDDTFGEAHGSLAVIELLEGQTEEASRRIEVAGRLDRDAFSTALARMLLEQSQGNSEKAEQIFRMASQQPILPDGSTLMDQLAKSLKF